MTPTRCVTSGEVPAPLRAVPPVAQITGAMSRFRESPSSCCAPPAMATRRFGRKTSLGTSASATIAWIEHEHGSQRQSLGESVESQPTNYGGLQ